VRMMLGENAAALYNFDLDALKPIAAEANIRPQDVSVPLPLSEIPEDSTCITFQRARAKEFMAANP
jgi:hypothetical protein